MKTKEEVLKTAYHLLDLVWPCEATRLLGLRLSNLVDKDEFSKSHGGMKLITDFAKVINKDQLIEMMKSRKKVPKEDVKEEDHKEGKQSKKAAKKRELESPAKTHRRKIKEDPDDIVKLDQFFRKKP